MATRRRISVSYLCTLVIASVVAVSSAAAQSPRDLDIYWIDVEGGAATLIVTPQGQSVLSDAGWGGFNDRDAARIEHVVRQEAGLTRIDYLLISHFHTDHAGGVVALAKRVPIGTFVDHGELFEQTRGNQELYNRYLAVAGDRRRIATAGERLELPGVELIVVASHSRFITTPLSDAAASPMCAEFTPKSEDRTENGKSLGFVLRMGQFEFVGLGDLTWNFQQQLACPRHLLGRIDIFQVPHHGMFGDVLPQLLWPMTPTVAVMNNGATKGGSTTSVENVLRSPGLEDFWALHRAVNNDAAHNAQEQLTANLGPTEGCEGHWIRARVNSRGTFELTNSRNGFTKSYQVK